MHFVRYRGEETPTAEISHVDQLHPDQQHTETEQVHDEADKKCIDVAISQLHEKVSDLAFSIFHLTQ